MSKDVESLEGLRSATGFLGGGGADFVLAFEATDERCLSLSALVSELNRFSAGESSTSSSEDRSIRFGAEFCLGALCGEGFLPGRFGRWLRSNSGKIDLDRCLFSVSISRNDAAIAALSSGSFSSENARALLEAAELPPPVRCGEEEDILPDEGPIEGSKKSGLSDVVTSRMKTATTLPGFSRTKSVYTSRSASPLSPTSMKLLSGKSPDNRSRRSYRE